MNKTHDLINEIISEHRYKMLEDDGDHIAIRYQFHVVHIFPNPEDEDFVAIVLSGFGEVSRENYSTMIVRCNKLNEQLKQVKFYITSDAVIASSEFFYKEKEDLAFQIQKSLLSLVTAGVRFKKLSE